MHEEEGRRGQAFNSLLAGGVIISGATLRRTLAFRRVRVNSYALVENSVLFDNVTVGRHAVVRNAIIDKNVAVPEGEEVGVDLMHDRLRGLWSAVVSLRSRFRFGSTTGWCQEATLTLAAYADIRVHSHRASRTSHAER